MGDLIIFDCETYYDKDYSLKKMPTPNYILDQRFELQIVAAKVNDGPHTIIDGPDFGAWLGQFDPKVTTTVSFNSLFDNSILAWRYGFVPHTMIDVMGMVRALIGHQMRHGVSLKEVAQFLGLKAKGTALANAMGMRRDEIIGRGLMKSFEDYCLDDNEICEGALLKLYPQFPQSERRIMDLVLRCCVQPRFHCDVPMLQAHLVDVQEAKAELLRAANNIDPKIIMSTPKFQAALEARGVDVEMKISPTTGLETPCFAKTDEFMETLQSHPDDVVAAMAAARLGLKSTLEETRTSKLISIATLPWNGPVEALARRAIAHEFDPDWNAAEHVTTPLMPIPLRYGGAHTHRLSGEWKMNMQNMPTVRGSKGKSKLRQSLIVPDDCRVVTCDLAQIEARICAWICGCTTLVDEFARNLDPYSRLATAIFGYPVDRKKKNPDGSLMFPIEGFIGKTGILGLGYGAGKDKFDTMVTQSARKDGLDLTGKYDRSLGDKAVDAYRARYWQIRQAWTRLNSIVAGPWSSPHGGTAKFGPCVISYGDVTLPSGLSLCYADPRQEIVVNADGEVRTEFRYRYGKFFHRLYGAKLLENIVQALARIVVMNAALRIRDRGRHTKYPEDYFFALQAHDELVFVVHKTEVDNLRSVVLEEMKRPPSWGKDIPLNAELGEGANYGEAK
jgi:DNA polymerase family A